MVSSVVGKTKVKESSADELHLVDAVLAALCFQSKAKKLPQKMDVQAVYIAFDKIRKQYPVWLQDLRFTYGPVGTVPVSGVLEDILFDLGASGIMAVENPWYKYLKIPRRHLSLISQAIAGRRSTTEQDELRNLADEFSKQYKKVAEQI